MDNIFECSNLTKTYGPVRALGGISFGIASGRILGLLGPNGSGKTTLIKLMNGLLRADAGQLTIGGHAPGVDTRKIVSYLPDRNYLPGDMSFDLSVRLFEDFYEDFDKAKAYHMLDNLGIDPKTRFKNLSKGNKEKVQLILVMSRRAKLYVLDEPIAGVDPATRDYILNTIVTSYDPGASLIISTHLISDVERVLDDVLFLKQGNIVLYNSADEVRREYGKSVDAVFRDIFSVGQFGYMAPGQEGGM